MPEGAAPDGRLLAAVGLSGSAAFVTVALGVATTKIIALVVGPAGIALLGLYRYLAALVTRSLLLGLDTTLVQRISTARDSKTSNETVGAAFLALVLQGVVVAGIGMGLAGLMGRWLFGMDPTASQVVEIRVVLAMAYVNLVLQLMIATLAGRAQVAKIAWVGVAAAVVTLLAIYPLLQLGTLGLAVNIGSGSAAGAGLAVLYVFRTYSSSWVRAQVRDYWRALSVMLARSGFLILHPVVMMTAMLSAQSLIHGQYALDGLGAYNAAMAILDTALMVIMASARSFVLPSLGQIEGSDTRARVVNRVLRLNLILASAATLVAIAGAPLLIPLLFSGRFGHAIEILPPFSLALVGQAFVWSYVMPYLHQAKYRLFFTLDLVWAATYVGATALVVARSASLAAAAWVYSGSYWVSGILYTIVAVRVFGPRMLEGANLRLGSLALLGTLGACLLHGIGSWPLDVAVLSVGLGALGWALRRGPSRGQVSVTP